MVLDTSSDCGVILFQGVRRKATTISAVTILCLQRVRVSHASEKSG